MERGRGFTVFVVIALLLGAAVGLNYIQNLNSPTDQEAEQQAQAKAVAMAKAMRANQAQSKANPALPVSALPPPSAIKLSGAVTTPSSSSNSAPPSDLVMGNPNAGTVVALGYTMDAGTAINYNQLNQIITAVKAWAKNHPNDTAKIICLDLPKDQLSNPDDQKLPLGLSINGKTVPQCDGNPGEGTFDLALAQIILTAIK